MLNPLDAPDAVSAAAEPLEDLLDDCNHVSCVESLHVVPVAGTAPWWRDLLLVTDGWATILHLGIHD